VISCNRIGPYTGWAKKRATLLLSISLPIDRFSKIFHWHTLQPVCDNVIIIDPMHISFIFHKVESAECVSGSILKIGH